MDTGIGLDLTSKAITIVAIVSIVYFAFILLFGAYFSKFSKNINDFFFSGQRFAWWLAAASMVATGIGSHSYIKYAEQGYVTGMSGSMPYLNDWFIIPFFMFGWLPIIYFARIKSIPEYFERRFNRTARYIAVVIILVYMFFYIGLSLYTLGVAAEGLFGIPLRYSVPIIALVLGAYVTFGGQTAVIFTDLVQGIMLYLAGGICIVAGVWALGGFDQFWGWMPLSHRLPFVTLNENPGFNTAGLFWGEALAGSIAFTFMNQGFIMRYLAIKSVNEGRKAALFNVLVTLPLSAVVVGAVGWIAKALVTKQAALGGLAGLDPIVIENTAYTFVVVAWEVLLHNSWLFGFVIAALSAALMSTVDTLINACAAIAIYDIYKPLIRPEASDRHYLNTARWASVISTLIGLLLVIWFNAQTDTIMAIHYKGIMLIIPSIVTTIFLGAFWKRFNATGAIVSMMVGVIFTIGTNWFPDMLRPLVWLVLGEPSPGNIYMPALFGMLVTAVVGVVTTLFTSNGKAKDITGLTIGTLDAAMEEYKGGTPHHDVGEKLRRFPVEYDDSIPVNQIALSPGMMARLKVQEGDIVYTEDSRWWLGGLRSIHAKAAPAHQREMDVVLMSKATQEDAMLTPGHTLTLEKIF